MSVAATPIVIAGRAIGPGKPPFVIAELSGNHNGSIERALAIIEVAASAGADAIKLQTYTADTMTIKSDFADFRVSSGPWAGRQLYDLYQEAGTPWDWHERLFAAGRRFGLPVFSTPFDETAVEFLESLAAPAYKIASFEIVHLELIAAAAATDKPIILSTGMASHEEIGAALETARSAGNGGVVLLHCVSSYPAPAEEMNLRAIETLASAFGCPVGLSDHSLDAAIPAAAVALGACVIEKHLTLSRADGGPDSGFSLEPPELRTMVGTARTVHLALGDGSAARARSESDMTTFRRSLYVIRDMAPGELFSKDTVRAIRPGFGLAPRHLMDVLGRRSTCPLERGTALTWECVGESG